MRYFIELSYHGKNYHGWQIQPNEISVQETVENALSLLLNQKIQVVGCGRTDAGVHASQFFLHFDFQDEIDKGKLKFKLNSFLPKDIAIFQIHNVQKEAHARFNALSRTYQYKMTLVKDPFESDLKFLMPQVSLDIEQMNKAAEVLLDFKDFKCFSRSKTDVKTYDCDISEAYWVKDNDELTFYITADRFLRNMVRAIVGTLLDIGKGKMTINDLIEIIESRDRTKAGASVKAKGLYLSKIRYPEHIFIN